MQIVAVAGRKGGTGKTLVTASFAACAYLKAPLVRGAEETDRARVAVLDLDPQGCLTGWYARRERPGPELVTAESRFLRERVEDFADQGFEYLFLDVGPGHGHLVEAAMRVADISVLPSMPGQLGIEVTAAAVRMALAAKVPYVIQPIGGTFRSRIQGQAITALRAQGLPLLPTIHHRVGAVLRDGLTAVEREPSSAAAREIWAAFLSLMELLR